MDMKKRLALVLALLLALCACGGGKQREEVPPPQPPVIVEPEPQPELEPEPLTATLAFCGDVVGHKPLNWDSYDPATGRYDYAPVISGAAPYAAAADYAVVNLETTLSGGPNYTGYPQFNSPDDWAVSLKAAGFDLVLTANNHCMDKGFSGLSRTLDVLDENGLDHVGTYRTQEEREENSGIVLADVGGISVAFLGYTYGTNGIPVSKDRPWSVNLFNLDYTTTLRTPDTEKIQADMAAARALEPDLIAVLVHWGVEYQTKENAYQEEMADLFIANGADLVLGGHAHVPQPMEWRSVTAEDGAERTGFVLYSIGNFVSCQSAPYTQDTAVFQFDLEKDQVTGEARVTGVDYRPMYMADFGKGAADRYVLLDVEKELARADISDALRAKLEKCAADCREIWGPRAGEN